MPPPSKQKNNKQQQTHEPCDAGELAQPPGGRIKIISKKIHEKKEKPFGAGYAENRPGNRCGRKAGGPVVQHVFPDREKIRFKSEILHQKCSEWEPRCTYKGTKSKNMDLGLPPLRGGSPRSTF